MTNTKYPNNTPKEKKINDIKRIIISFKELTIQ